MDEQTLRQRLDAATLEGLFPPGRSDEFFEALFGDPSEGAYDISLSFGRLDGTRLLLYLDLRQRPGHCLACNLTYGLPQVFSRHPVIDIEGLVRELGRVLEGVARPGSWKLGSTVQESSELHRIPLEIELEQA